MTGIETLATLLSLAAGGWAAWSLPRWTGEGYRHQSGPESGDWTADGLPSRPFGDLRSV
jgi:hypothetical protein